MVQVGENRMMQIRREFGHRIPEFSWIFEQWLHEQLDAVQKQPHISARFWLLVLPKRSHFVGDLQEEYMEIILPEYGLKAARRWYRKQVLCSLWAFAVAKVKEAVLFRSALR
jgi:hypothetical protein